jgi:hypothetical protein
MVDPLELDGMVRRLRDGLRTALAAVDSGPGDAAARASVAGGLRQIGGLIDRLDGPLRADVLAGRMELARWRAIAQTHAGGIRSISGEAVTWGKFWDEVLVQSGHELGQVASSAVSAGASLGRWLPWALGSAAALVLAVLVWRVVPRG